MQEWSRKDLEESINGHRSSLLYLYTPMCGTCQMAGRMLTITAEILPNLQMGKADLNYMPDIAEHWGIESVPCLLIFKEGKLEEKIYAFRSVPFLLEVIKKNL